MCSRAFVRAPAIAAGILVAALLPGCFGCDRGEPWTVIVTVDRGSLAVPDRVSIEIVQLLAPGGATLTSETREFAGGDLFASKGSSNAIVLEPVAEAGAVRIVGTAIDAAGAVAGSGTVEGARFAGTAALTLLLVGPGSDGGTWDLDAGTDDAGGGTDAGAPADAGGDAGTDPDGGPAPGCGDSACAGGETCATCPGDCGICPPACPDGSCDAIESCGSCPADCGACPVVCGDAACVAPENCATCPTDCGICPPSCPNGMCGFGETCSNCPMDCGPCCGNGLCQPAYGESCVTCSTDCGICPTNCSDTLDNDADALTDWPNDPGCVDTADDDETDPAVAPECADGTDDDGDGYADFPTDPGCEDAADDREIDPCVPGREIDVLPAAGNVAGTTAGTSLMEATCNSGTSLSGPEAVWRVDVPVVATVTFSTLQPGTGLASSLSVRTDCGAVTSELACVATPTLGETLTIPDLAAGSYYVMIDGQDMAAGPYELAVWGTIASGAPCEPASVRFTCGAGHSCAAGPGPTGFVCVLADCANAGDDDGDSLVDFPADPGCTAANDGSEVDPPVPPQCANGADDDGDALVDWPADPSCTAASDDSETCALFDGPDGFGYVGCEELPAAVPCENTSTTGTGVSLTDDSSVSVPLPFPFDYYGTVRSSVSIVSNGKLGFPGTTSYANSCTIETDTIAAWWDDLFPPSGGTVTYETFGAAPNRHFTVTWLLPHIGGTWPNTVDVRVTLYEGSNDIAVCYVDTDLGSPSYSSGASATTGIAGSSGSDTLSYSCNTPSLVDGLVLLYLHP